MNTQSGRTLCAAGLITALLTGGAFAYTCSIDLSALEVEADAEVYLTSVKSSVPGSALARPQTCTFRAVR